MGSDRTRNYGAKREDLLLFDPEALEVVCDPTHPLYDKRVEEPLEEALVRNIMRYGVKQSISVRLNGKRPDGTPLVEVVAGRRRVLHAREANRRLVAEGKIPIRVPARPERGDDADVFGVMISENEQRKGDGPVARAEKLNRYLQMGRTKDEAEITFGLSRAAIDYHLKLLDCAAPVKAAVAEGRVPVAVATKLSTLPREQQGAALKELIAAGATKGTRARAAAKAVTEGGSVERAVRDADKAKRMRPRAFLVALRGRFEKANTDTARAAADVVAFILGDDTALDDWPSLHAAACRTKEA